MPPVKCPEINDPGGDAGLTLIEMIVVLAIIALVAALIVPSVIGRPDQARVTIARADMRAIGAALKLYRLDSGDYPTTAQGLAALVVRPATGPAAANWSDGGYLAHPALDPWSHAYAYRGPDAGAGYALMSFGRDGKSGGTGVDTDLEDGGL